MTEPLGAPVLASAQPAPFPGDGTTLARRVGVSAGTQVVVQVLHMLLNVVSSLVIIRYLAPTVYGDFVLVMTLVTLIGMISDFGINKLGVRNIAVQKGCEGEVIGTIVLLRLALAAAAAVLVEVALVTMGRGPEVRTAAAIACLTLVANAVLSVTIAFDVRLWQHVSAAMLLLGELVETGLVLWLAVHHGSLVQLFGAVATGGAVAAAVALAVTRRRLSLGLRFEPAAVVPLLREAWPLAVASVVGIMLIKMDALMLAVLRPPRDLGAFGAAYAPVEYLVVAAIVLSTVLLPLLSRSAGSDPDRFLALYQRGTELLLVFTLPLCLIIVIFAGPAVAQVYSDSYAAAITPLRLLGLYLVVISLCAWAAIVLLALGHQRLTVRCNSVMLGVAVGVQLVLIPRLGAPGAALGSVLVGATTAGWALVLVHRTGHVHLDGGRVVRILAANCLLGATAWSSYAAGLDYRLAAALGAATYLPGLLLVGVGPRDLARAVVGSAPSSLTRTVAR